MLAEGSCCGGEAAAGGKQQSKSAEARAQAWKNLLQSTSGNLIAARIQGQFTDTQARQSSTLQDRKVVALKSHLGPLKGLHMSFVEQLPRRIDRVERLVHQ